MCLARIDGKLFTRSAIDILLIHGLYYFFQVLLLILHCVASVRIRSHYGRYFPAFGLNTERYGENTDQNNSEYRYFLRSINHQLFNLFQASVPVLSHLKLSKNL